MKRYLIFGFLTILIITLNFAFIIVLVQDDVEVNYAVLYFLWILVISIAAGLAYLENHKRRKKEVAEEQKKMVTEDVLKPTAEEVSPTLVYKYKSIKKFSLRLSEDFNTKLKPGFFGGYVISEEFSNETVQAVYLNEGQLLGYISKKEEQLVQNLEQLYKEPLICWGNIVWNEMDQHFNVKGHLPVLYSEPETHRFQKLILMKQELLELQTSQEPIDMASFLEKAENFCFLKESEKTPSSLNYSIDPGTLVAYSQHLLAVKNWKALKALEKLPVLISYLEPQHKKEVSSAIEKAKNKLQDSL